jgi:hypothetical protein
MDGTIIVRGNFVSTGADKTIVFRPGVNWITVFNMLANDGVGAPLQFYFQTGMTNGVAIDGAGATTAPAGMFTVIDYSNPANFASIKYTTTAQTNAVQPVVTSAATTAAVAVAVGNIVRITGRNVAGVLGVPVFGNYGVDMIVSVVAGNDYTLLGANNALATASGVAGTDGALQRIDISSRFYPANRIVTSITQAAGVITVATSVPHGMTVGQQVRFDIPAVCGAGISALLSASSANNYVSATVTSVVANTATLAGFGSVRFTIDIVGSGETFTYPTSAQVAAGSQLPEMIPFGQDTAYSVSQNANILADATVNQGFVGIKLRGGAARANNPAGQAGDVIFWKVGACFNSEEYA